MMSICLTWFPIDGLGEPYLYHNLVNFTRMWEDCGGLSDCEELSGGYSYKDNKTNQEVLLPSSL